ncbi:ExeM/NucH family extracellular endonuclease [Nocardioides taihuensis]|uniref:ExeM/NucH family extracellular endonuclease n=1 Tax=Nocardioides taihuensis TaxID=1835606 RepID=A0ABW0BRS7_9ACTN
MLSSRQRFAAAVGLGLAVSVLTSTPSHANPAGTGLVIKEVYGGGGNAGAQYTNDFIELYNPTTAPISVAGWSVQYRSATGTSAQVTPLSGSVPAGAHYLVQEAAGGTPSASLPAPDATGTISMSGSAGVVLLVPSTTAFATTGNLAGNAGLVDMVGYGSTAGSFEAANTGVNLTNTTAATRSATGGDTDNNADDFSEVAPTPTNSATGGGGGGDAGEKTIAQIQGDDTATSPLAGQTVTTTGRVTASFPSGGFNGFYLQTGGADTTPAASDGVFVYTPALTQAAYPSVGDSLQVKGTVSEFGGLTEITAAPADITTVAALPAVVPLAEVPGTSCALPGDACLTGAAIDAAREKHEGELVQPAGAYTVTDSYDGSAYNGGSASSSMFGEIGLAANSDLPLVAPTELYDAQTGPVAARTAYNNAHRVVLDDGSSLNYTTAANTGSPFPYYTADHTVRVGAGVTFDQPFVLDYRFGWKAQPQHQVVGAPTGLVSFEQTREAQPQDVGGDVRLATFNVLNYFTTLGADVAGCEAYVDRAGDPVTVRTCSGANGPRGAWDAEDLQRQQTKIVTAINKLDADVVSLEEIENSLVVDGHDRDEAVATLVDALNADAGAGTWAYAPSPTPADLPSGEDVIRTAFIYQPATVALVGGSQILVGATAFDNAREPLAQAFKAAGTSDADAFAVIANHFKSKGSGTPDPYGQGNANEDRVNQAQALLSFADSFAVSRGTQKVFLTGDFNAYSHEDPIEVLEAGGFTSLDSTSDPQEESYSFDGQVGSLDHVLANEAALPDVTGVDVWTINAYESVYYEYSRNNYNVTDLYSPGPFRSSDHNPELVGIDTPAPEPGTRDIQVLATNDFHGRIANDPQSAAAGAAVMAGAVKQMRAANPDTVFAAAGDLIGASTFDSFIAHDKPTIDALNEAGLQVSAAGNHEFDQGYRDLVDRVMAPYDAETNPYGGAQWKYIAANVRMRSDDSHALAPSWTQDFGKVEVGFVGAVTEHLPELVSPAGISEITVTDVVDEVNAAADDLRADGADVVVLLVHEGAENTNCATMDDNPASDFGSIITGVDGDVDAIVSGHTHLAYNCSFPVDSWAGRPVTERPVVSAGQYGEKLNRLVFTVDTATGQVQAKTQEVLNLKAGPTGSTFNYPVDPATQSIVDAAVAEANVLGAVRLGDIAGPFKRAQINGVVNGQPGLVENRGGESTLGNLVAEVQRWATSSTESGSAQIAFMNPGGLRADMIGTQADGYPETLTYRQAANVQPFANTLVNMRLTGAQIRAALEQQWQPAGASRPFLRLGVSKGFTYTYDPTAAAGSRIKQMRLDGVLVDPTTTYSVTVNSFLASGGDNFGAFAGGTQKRDTGKVDLQAMVDYMAEFAADTPLPVDWSQRAVGISFPAAAPSSYRGGEHVTFDVSSWDMTGAGDTKDARVQVSLDGTDLGSFPVDHTVGSTIGDEYGKAAVDVVIPNGTSAGQHQLTLAGHATGTSVTVPVTVAATTTTVAATAADHAYGTAGSVQVSLTPATATGEVTVLEGDTVLGTGTLVLGATSVTLGGTALEVGAHTLTVRYAGDAGHEPSSTTTGVTVTKAAASVATTFDPTRVTTKSQVSLTVDVTAAGVTPTGAVRVIVNGTTTTRTLSGGSATFALGRFVKAGSYPVTVTYLGDTHVQQAADTVTLVVNKK